MDETAPSYWLRAHAPLRTRDPLDGQTTVDVAILGAGFTGLWTAYALLGVEPSLDVLVIERRYVGFGASGRNGGWVTPHTATGMGGSVERFGRRRAHDLQAALHEAVDHVGEVAEREGIDAGYVRTGRLWIARGEHQRPALERTQAAYEDAGFGDRYRLLDRRQLGERIRVAGAVAAQWSPTCATVDPARLVRGLASAVERRGGRIVEATTVTGFSARTSGSGRPVLETDRGDVHAEVAVLAGEAYLSELRPFRRRLLPLYSLIVLTEPIDDPAWERIGWERREAVASERLTVEYLTRTADQRILFGGRGAPYRFGSAITGSAERHTATHDRLRRAFLDWFPALDDVRFDDAWGGVLAAPRDGLPTATYSPRSGLALAGGYTGSGVAWSNLAGRTLADLILGRETVRTRLPFVGHRLPPWPPEPLRWLGVRAVERSAAAVDNLGDRTGRPVGRRVVEAVLP